MTSNEKIKSIMDIAGVSEGEAIHALETMNWDTVDALVFLKNNSKKSVDTDEKKAESQSEIKSEGNILDKIMQWKFQAKKNNQEIGNYPLLLVLLALIFIPKITLLFLIVMIFLSYRFSVSGFTFANNINYGLEFVYVLVDKAVVFLKKNKFIK